jgi:hypothetical protein
MRSTGIETLKRETVAVASVLVIVDGHHQPHREKQPITLS